MTDVLDKIFAQLAAIQAEQQRMSTLLEKGITPPQWVSGKDLALALNLGDRGAEYWRNDLGVIPVDGVACRFAGKAYEYNVAICRQLIEDYQALSAQAKRALREAWKRSKEVA